jgi:YesN/AraC family two-component response regulator
MSSSKKSFDISVLYVEDEELTLETVGNALKIRVKELDLARNGKEGLELFKKKKHDVVITDIKMPIMNGLDMSREIKKIKKDTTIIVTTAYSDTDLLIECIDIGVNQFVLKPIMITKVLEAIHKCLELSTQK